MTYSKHFPFLVAVAVLAGMAAVPTGALAESPYNIEWTRQVGDQPPRTVPVVKLRFLVPEGQPLHFVEA